MGLSELWRAGVWCSEVCTRDSLMKHGFIQLKVYAPNMQTALRVDAIGEKVYFR